MQTPLDSDEATALAYVRVVPAHYLSGLKARLLLGVTLRSDKEAQMVSKAFAPYQ
jgi:hypothetical protein